MYGRSEAKWKLRNSTEPTKDVAGEVAQAYVS